MGVDQSTPAPSRAGRNLPAAIAVGVGLGAVILGSLFWQKVLFIFVVLAAVLVAVDELIRVFHAAGAKLHRVPLFAGTTAMAVAAYFGGPLALLVAMALTVLATIFWRMPDGSVGFVRDVTTGTFLISYVPLLAGFAILLVQPEDDGPQRVVTFFLVVVASDVGGYVAGILFGKHPMAPTISPKKTWEGFAGSTLACIGAGIGSVVARRRLVGRCDRRCGRGPDGNGRRSGRVDDQARSRHQGHVQPAARPRWRDGPAGFLAGNGSRGLAAAAPAGLMAWSDRLV